MGWRSWNFFQCNINQGIMQAQMDALTLPRHGTSLLRLGYEAVGLDDCWQSCTGKGGSFHDEAGQPMINTSLFPSMAAMVEHGHAQGVKVGFYQVSLPAAAAAGAAADAACVRAGQLPLPRVPGPRSLLGRRRALRPGREPDRVPQLRRPEDRLVWQPARHEQVGGAVRQAWPPRPHG